MLSDSKYNGKFLKQIIGDGRREKNRKEKKEKGKKFLVDLGCHSINIGGRYRNSRFTNICNVVCEEFSGISR